MYNHGYPHHRRHHRHCISMQTGDVPDCDPKQYYECVLGSKMNYVKDNEASNCNCPRQCHRLTYETTVSQAKLRTSAVEFMMSAFNLNGTVNEFIDDYCVVEVRKS